MDSFTVRCIFLWDRAPDQRLRYLYEERITLWQAETIDAAIELAEDEAKTYASDNGIAFLETSQAFAMFDSVNSSGIEVFSLLRESDQEPMKYIDTFFDTGYERQGDTS